MSYDMIEMCIVDYIPDTYYDADLLKKCVRDIHFRIEDLDHPVAHTFACINYILAKGSIEALIDEEDDGEIWEYYDGTI